ncbi:MAG: endonuclease domain-containing protein, partial [Rhodanobacter sp.]
MTTTMQPRLTQVFHFTRVSYADGVAELGYAFEDGPEMVETIRFPGAPAIPASRRAGFDAALKMLHLIAGVSYYK